MGAHDYIITVREADQAAVRKRWEAQVREDSYESGSGAYAGNATTMKGSITFHDKKFASEEEAREYILDHHDKWGGPLAASFYLPAETTERDKARIEAARERFEGLCGKQYECARGIVQSFIDRKSEYVGCKGCGSKLSHAHLVKNMSLGNVSEYKVNLNGRPRHKTFTMPTMPVCPVCSSSLLSETDGNRLAGHAEKVAVGQKDYDEALKPKTGKALAWAVGGWAAS